MAALREPGAEARGVGMRLRARESDGVKSPPARFRADQVGQRGVPCRRLGPCGSIRA